MDMGMNKPLISILGCVMIMFAAMGAGMAEDMRVDDMSGSSVIGAKTSAAIRKALDDAEASLMPSSEKQAVVSPKSPGVTFFVRKVQLEANLLVSDAVLAPLLAEYEGRDQSMKTMQALADKITSVYRSRGYLSSLAYIPPQDVTEGVFRISVVEGRIGRIIFEGNEKYSSVLLQRYCDLQEGDFFSYQKLQESIAKLNAHPDRIVRAIVRRSDLPDRTDVIFKVEERGLTHGSIFGDNQGSKSVGRNRFGLGLRRDNLLGQDDILRMGTMAGKNFGSIFLEHALPVPKLNSVWKTGASFAKSAPKKQYTPYGVTSTTWSYWGRMETKFITEESLALDWKTGLDIKDSRTLFLSVPNNRERLRILRFGPALTLKDDWGGTVIENQFSVGLNGLGAAMYSASSQRTGVTPDFFVSELTVNRMQKMPMSTRLSLKGRLHMSPDRLPSSEQLSLGGADSVRGYPEGDYFADEGILVNAEYLVPFFFLPDAWKMPGAKARMRDQLDMAFFWDSGYGRFKNPGAGQKGSDSLSGAGVGLRVRMSEAIYFTTDFAYAIGARPNASDSRFRIHSGMQANW